MTIKRDPETEKFINTLEDSEKYLFMRDELDKVTNEGDEYDPELHDVQVFESAAERYGITVETATGIYDRIEFAISDFQQKRFKK
jgi:hypothetical protein